MDVNGELCHYHLKFSSLSVMFSENKNNFYIKKKSANLTSDNVLQVPKTKTLGK